MSVDRKEVIMVNVDLISPDPNQPRTEFSDEEIAATAFTIESQGIINPIEIDEKYMIVTGEIRWRAAQKAGLKQIPCVVWKDGTHKRFERQVVENLHHHQLSDRDREAAIVKLWKMKTATGEPMYATFGELGKAVGLGKSRVNDILEANEFRETTPVLEQGGISSSDIVETRYLENPEQRIKILKSVQEGKLKSSDIREAVKLAKTSNALLDKVLDQRLPIQRAIETAEAMNNIAKRGVALTDDQKQNLADKVAEDETLLDKYKDAVLERVKGAVTKSKTSPRIEEPISPTSPVQNIIRVKDEVMDRFRVYIGRCTMNERRWAKRTMIEIRDELNELIEMIKDE